MSERSLAEQLVDLNGVDPKMIEAFIALVKQQAQGAVAVLTFTEIWKHYEVWGSENLGAWRNVQAIQARRHLLPFWGARPWPECGYTAADEYVRMRKAAKSASGGRTISPATINRELATPKAMFNWALRRPELGVKHNPLARYPDLAETSDRKFSLSEEDFVALIEHSRPVLRLMLIFALETGMRRDEWRLLEWSEVDLAMGIVRLSAERTKARRARDVPLSDLAIQVLNQARIPGSSWVFPSPTSGDPKPIPKSTLGQWFDQARKDAGVTGPRSQAVWIHTIRKTSVTEKLMAGLDLQKNMDMHGHTSKEIHDEYRVLTPEYMQATRDALNRRRGPKAIEARPQPEPSTAPDASGESSPLLRFVSTATKR